MKNRMQGLLQVMDELRKERASSSAGVLLCANGNKMDANKLEEEIKNFNENVQRYQ